MALKSYSHSRDQIAQQKLVHNLIVKIGSPLFVYGTPFDSCSFAKITNKMECH